MLEVRYIKSTGQLTGWCGDRTQFGNLDRGRDTEVIVILDTPIPTKPMEALSFNGEHIVDNSDYVELITRDALVEIDKLRVRVEKLEKEKK